MRRLLVLTALAAALTAGAQQRIVRLWNNASAPHDNGLRGGERVEEDRLFNTTEAVLYVYAADPARATGQAAVVCPGGGYRFLSIGGDGHAVGRWLAEHGVTAAVLKYRLPNGRCEVPLEDTEAALRYLRRTAPDFRADSAQVGIVGCSAGGHLAASAATMLPEEVRPAFAKPRDRLDAARIAAGGRRRPFGAAGQQRSVLCGAQTPRHTGLAAHLPQRRPRRRTRPRPYLPCTVARRHSRLAGHACTRRSETNF